MSVSKIVAAAASGVGGAGLDVDEVFSCFLYDGNSSTQTITNSIDLSGEGGLVWIKARDSGQEHNLYDTKRGVYKFLQSQSTAAEDQNVPKGLTAFNSNGFSLDVGNESGSSFNNSSYDYASWTFRKAPKFFDVVTYTGSTSADGGYNRIAHSLGTTVGMLLVKRLDTTADWVAYVRNSSGTYIGLRLNSTLGQQVTFSGGANTINDTNFSAWFIGENTDGASYVAYLFAHNNNDGGFGPDSDQDIIKCGSYTGNGSTTGPVIDLGFEPQWVMLKRTDSADEWFMYDVMRGFDYSTTARLSADSSSAESPSLSVVPTSTGFQPVISHGSVNASSGNYVYMAIRRGPLAVPEDATKVFHVNNYSGNSSSNIHNTGFNVDMNINTKAASYTNYIIARLTGGQTLQTNVNNAAIDYSSGGIKWFDNKSNHIDLSTGWFTTHNDVVSYSWRRAPSYFDVCCYSGTGSARTVSHNLGVVPEMMWIKKRNSTQNWAVYHKGTNGGTDPEDYGLELNSDSAEFNTNLYFNDTAPTSTVFTVANGGAVNASGDTYIAYLFATVAGVSKVGSYDGNGSNQNIDCGFSSGARFILIKSRQSGGWYVFDTVRGIVAGNDSHLRLDTDAAEAYADSIDTYSGGFNVVQNSTTDLNKGPSDESYIFYAIA